MKYIIYVPDEVVEFVGSEMNIFIEPKIKTVVGQRHYAFRLSNEDIAIYTEPDHKAIEDEVWKFYKTISNMKIHEQESVFGTSSWWKVINKHSYREAKSKYDVWKKGKEKICPGDEIEYYHGDIRNTFVVFDIDKDNWLKGGTLYKGKEWCWETCRMSSATKTGRHFPEVAELLQKMRSEEG